MGERILPLTKELMVKFITNMFKNEVDIKGMSITQLSIILKGLEMIIDQYPCKASELRKDHADKVYLAEVEAMYLVLGGK